MSLPSARTNYGGLTLLRLGPSLNVNDVKSPRFQAAHQDWHGGQVPDRYWGYVNLVTLEVFVEQLGNSFSLMLGYTRNQVSVQMPASEWSETLPLPQDTVDKLIATYGAATWRPDGSIKKHRFKDIDELCAYSEKYAKRNLMPNKGWIALDGKPLIVAPQMIEDAMQDVSRAALKTIGL